jgi:antitoxin YefM
MDAITYTDLRANLAQTMQKVCDDHMPMIVTRQKAESVVIMSLDDYHSMEETFYLMRNPKNAEILRRRIGDIEAGKGIEKDLQK